MSWQVGVGNSPRLVGPRSNGQRRTHAFNRRGISKEGFSCRPEFSAVYGRPELLALRPCRAWHTPLPLSASMVLRKQTSSMTATGSTRLDGYAASIQDSDRRGHFRQRRPDGILRQAEPPRRLRRCTSRRRSGRHQIQVRVRRLWRRRRCRPDHDPLPAHLWRMGSAACRPDQYAVHGYRRLSECDRLLGACRHGVPARPRRYA